MKQQVLLVVLTLLVCIPGISRAELNKNVAKESGDGRVVYLEETDEEIIMRNSITEVRIHKDKGDIHSLSIKNVWNVLSYPAQFIFKDTLTSVEYYQSLDGTVDDIQTYTCPSYVSATFTISFVGYDAYVVYTLDEQSFRWDVDIHLHEASCQDRGLRIDNLP
jgi:hypothetical protein